MEAANLGGIFSPVQSDNPVAILRIVKSALAGDQTEITVPETFIDYPMFEDGHEVVHSDNHDGVICYGI